MLYIESEILELKSSLSEWKEVIISLCAFANKKGGKVIVGLDNNGQPTNQQIGYGSIEDIANKIKTNTDPPLYPSINIKTFALGEIVELDIPESE
ncbi:MAG: ATP-binding protein [Bacteroidia bacterium]|nr:ATP-binding protein [Bacteroidia bacterium]